MAVRSASSTPVFSSSQNATRLPNPPSQAHPPKRMTPEQRDVSQNGYGPMVIARTSGFENAPVEFDGGIG
eukprot:13066803-Heterocapsa_arctica.AAC.1